MYREGHAHLANTVIARSLAGYTSTIEQPLMAEALRHGAALHPFAVPRVGTQPGGSKQCWCFVIIPSRAWRSHRIINQPKSPTHRLAERGASARIDASQPQPKIAVHLTHAVILVLFVILHQHCCASGSDLVVLQGCISERSPDTRCGS